MDTVLIRRTSVATGLVLALVLALIGVPKPAHATADWLWHDYNTVPSNPHPASPTEVWVNIGYQFYVDEAAIYYTTDGTEPQGSYGSASNGQVVSMSFSHVEWDAQAGQYTDWWHGSIPTQPEGTVVKYKVAAWHSGGGDIVFADNNVNSSAEATEFAYYSSDFESPEWAKDAVIYHIFVDRFYDGDPTNNIDYTGELDGYMGGDLQGIRDNLSYLDDLGVTAIWLSPVFEGEEYHGYHITDFEDVEENFGTLQDLEYLVNDAHALDIKVILDYVPNHSASTHPFFVDASTNCSSSPYYDWYIFHNCPPSSASDYETFFGVAELPQLNNENPDTRDYTIGVAVDFVRDYNIDGLRLDYVLGKSENYWVDFRAAVKDENPDVFLLGEAWESPDIKKRYEGELDGLVDFTLLYTFRDFFANRSINVDQFDSDLDTYEGFYDSEFLLGKFLSNHDVNRFLWESGNNTSRLQLAATAQFTLQDPPIIYQGDEVGQSQEKDISEGDKYVRAPMLWGSEQDGDVLEHYKRLISIRNEYPALRTGDRTTLHRHNDNGTYAFARTHTAGDLVVAMNNGDQPRTVTVPNLPGESIPWPDGTHVTDVLGGGTYTVDAGEIVLSLDAMTGAVLVPETSTDAEVTFTVTGYVTQFGEDMYVVGSSPELGYWDPDKAAPLEWVASDEWSGDVLFTSLTMGENVEYKYIVKDGSSVTWQSGSNQSIEIPTSGTKSVNDTW